MRPTFASISSSALKHNLQRLRQYAPHAKIMAVIKTDAYGHGLLAVAQQLDDADGFAVLSVDEAVQLRDAGIDRPILILSGPFEAQELHAVAGLELDVAVHSLQQLAWLESFKPRQGMSIHLNIDTGMHRLGLSEQEFQTALDVLQRTPHIKNITLMTHFARGEEDISEQLACFRSTTQGLSFPTSLANSATMVCFPEERGDWVRPGIMLYGVSSIAHQSASQLGLQAVMRLSSEIISTRKVKRGAKLGYGHGYTAPTDMRIGIVAIGYADGYPRHAPTGTPVIVGGQLTHSLGTVNMDMLYVDISALPEANIGTSVELWGDHLAVERVAGAAGTIAYELLCALSPRVSRKLVDTL